MKRKLRLAGLAISWERLWPRLAPAVLVAAVFLAFGWLRIFDLLGDWPRVAAVAIFGLVFLAALAPLVGFRRSAEAERIGRLERDSGYEHRPLTAVTDRQAGGEDDPVARALWEAHRRRVMAGLTAIRVKAPSPRLDRRDPYALRAAVFLLFVVGLVAARGDWLDPLKAAVSLPVIPGPDVRVDAWVTPPGYTGRAPIFLTRAAEAPAGEVTTGEAAAPVPGRDTPVDIPAGSILSLRVNGLDAPEVRFLADDAPVPAEGTPAGVAVEPAAKAVTAAAAPVGQAASAEPGVTRPTAYEWILDRSGTVTLGSAAGEHDRLRFAVEPDRAPTIKLTEEPAATARGAFRLAYEVGDDYRVAGARATFADPKTPLKPILGTASADPRPLVGAPEMPLVLPRKGAEKKTAETFRDLSAHPWAGGTVTMRLEAKDDAGNVGFSEPVDVVIPARPFRHPVARMLVEQRRNLALDAGAAPSVIEILDIVGLYSPEFIDDASVHLGLRVLRVRLADARDDEDLRGALDLMWQMALALDGGDASLAEQRLREARERLRDALQNGASKEEIARLTEELRKAMQEYMQALQEQMRNNPNLAQEMNRQQMQNAQTITPEDFQKMIDRIEELSKLGDREAAEQLLSQLDQMLENLQMAQPRQGQNQDGQQGKMNEMMNELADMIRRQQELMNETHKMTPDGQPQTGEGMSEEQMQEALRQLQQGQGDLQKRLEQMMKGMQENGMQPGEQLGEAQKSMKGAEGSLGEGETGDALGQQGQALDQLRQGAQQLAEQMGEQEGEGQPGQGRSAYQEDPLGRPNRRKGPDYGDSVKVPGEIEVQRARRILDELRRRFSDQNRPALELDYLQRLLTPF